MDTLSIVKFNSVATTPSSLRAPCTFVILYQPPPYTPATHPHYLLKMDWALLPSMLLCLCAFIFRVCVSKGQLINTAIGEGATHPRTAATSLSLSDTWPSVYAHTHTRTRTRRAHARAHAHAHAHTHIQLAVIAQMVRGRTGPSK